MGGVKCVSAATKIGFALSRDESSCNMMVVQPIAAILVFRGASSISPDGKSVSRRETRR